MKGALTFSCLWGQSHSPLCSPVGWPGTAGTCCHPQSASDYTISLSHSPHPASQATWKGLWEPPQTAWDGHMLTFQSNLYLNWGGTGDRRMGCILSCTYREYMFVFVHACVCVNVFTFPLSIYWLPCWESDGIACEQIICHVRYKWQTAFNSASLYSAPHSLSGNCKRTVEEQPTLPWGHPPTLCAL